MASVSTGLISQLSWVSPLHSSLWREQTSNNTKKNASVQTVATSLYKHVVFHSLFLNVVDQGNHRGEEEIKEARTLFNQSFLQAWQTNESTYVYSELAAVKVAALWGKCVDTRHSWQASANAGKYKWNIILSEGAFVYSLQKFHLPNL